MLQGRFFLFLFLFPFSLSFSFFFFFYFLFNSTNKPLLKAFFFAFFSSFFIMYYYYIHIRILIHNVSLPDSIQAMRGPVIELPYNFIGFLVFYYFTSTVEAIQATLFFSSSILCVSARKFFIHFIFFSRPTLCSLYTSCWNFTSIFNMFKNAKGSGCAIWVLHFGLYKIKFTKMLWLLS